MANDLTREAGGVWVLPRGRLSGAIYMTKAQHREILKEFDERVSAGGVPAKVWRSLMSRQVSSAILAIMLQVERRRLVLGLSGEALSEKAGLPERGYFKWLRPWRGKNCCRTPGEDTLVALINAVSGAVAGDGWRLPIPERLVDAPPALSRDEYERKLQNLAVRHQRPKSRPYREHLCRRMGEISPMGVEARQHKLPREERRRIAGLGGATAARNMTPEQRKARGRTAALARWGGKANQAPPICG